MWLRAGSNRASRLLASIVLLVKISRSKTPERVDAVGVAPTASKVFTPDGKSEHFRCLSKIFHKSHYVAF